MSSIREIAKLAGVSVATVSRAFNNYEDISEKTKLHIMKIAKELNYMPNAVARGLVTKKTKTIGVFFGDHQNSGLNHPVLRDALSAIRMEAGQYGYDLLIFTHRRLNDSSTYVSLCRERGVDGVIMVVTGPDKHLNGQVLELIESRIPTVALDMPITGKKSTYVESDNLTGARLAVEHLADLGHRAIAMVAGDQISKTSFDRLTGFVEGLKMRNLPIREEWIVYGGYDQQVAREAAYELLRQYPEITAVFAASDLMAFGVIEAGEKLGRKVPQDLSVVGFDDIELAQWFRPSLTTVRQERFDIGTAAIRCLYEIMEKGDIFPRSVTLPTALVIRETTAKKV